MEVDKDLGSAQDHSASSKNSETVEIDVNSPKRNVKPIERLNYFSL